jgi:seryl-tRNA synthetase
LTIKDSTTLKGLETKYKEIETKRNMVIKSIDEKQAEASKLKKEMGQIKQQIDNIKSKTDGKIVVSEHAMLRYIERILGIDLDELQKKILDEEDAKTIRALGNCTYPKDGFKLKIKDGTVVTVLGENDV